MKFLLFLFVLVLAMLGFSEFLHILKLFWVLPKCNADTRLFIRLKEEIALKQIAFAGEQYLWLGKKYADSVIAVANGLTDQTLLECQDLAKKYNIKIYCERKGDNGYNIGNY